MLLKISFPWHHTRAVISQKEALLDKRDQVIVFCVHFITNEERKKHQVWCLQKTINNEQKHFLCKVHKPKTKDELANGITTFWRTRMTRDKCNRYIDHLAKVIPVVIEREGRASGY